MRNARPRVVGHEIVYSVLPLFRKWNRHLLELAISKLGEEFVLSPGVPGGMERYRQALSQSFFLKFFMNVDKQMKVRKNVPNYENLVL